MVHQSAVVLAVDGAAGAAAESAATESIGRGTTGDVRSLNLLTMTHKDAAKLKKKILKMVMENMPPHSSHEDIERIARKFYSWIMEGMKVEDKPEPVQHKPIL